MALYHVHFFDFGDNIRASHSVEHEDDDGAIATAHRLNILPHMTRAFEVWQGDRLVHRHEN
jgi:hypothetical protein